MGLIHIVAALGYDWAVELLLQSNADVQLRVSYWFYLKCEISRFCCINGYHVCCIMIVIFSSHLQDPWGLTPLHWAAAKGHEVCLPCQQAGFSCLDWDDKYRADDLCLYPQNTIAVLLRYGANGNATSYTLGAVNGFTPADLASMHNHSGIAAYLSETHLAQGLSKLRLSDDRSSLRKRNRNRPVNMSQSNDTAAEEEVSKHMSIHVLDIPRLNSDSSGILGALLSPAALP